MRATSRPLCPYPQTSWLMASRDRDSTTIRGSLQYGKQSAGVAPAPRCCRCCATATSVTVSTTPSAVCVCSGSPLTRGFPPAQPRFVRGLRRALTDAKITLGPLDMRTTPPENTLYVNMGACHERGMMPSSSIRASVLCWRSWPAAGMACALLVFAGTSLP